MKKLFVLTIALCLTGIAFSQSLPDGKFEEWKKGETYEKKPFDELANPFWQTLNMLSTLPPSMGTGPIVVFKDNGISGFCPKMKSDTLTLGNETIFLPGVVGAITVIIDDQTAKFGRPYTYRPDSLVGYIKYSPVNNDSASIFVRLYKNGQTIGNVEQKFYGEVNEWTKVNLPIRYRGDDVPDSATVLFIASAAYNFDNLFACKGSVGSTLWVDDFDFWLDGKSSLSFEKEETLEMSVYPNPSDGKFSVNLPEKATVEIFSMSGSLIKTAVLGSGSNEMSLSKSGIYILRAKAGNKVAVERIVVK